MVEPTRAYSVSIAEQTAHHERSKTFSGSLLAPHMPAIGKLIRERGYKTALDYGCGKAKVWDTPDDGSKALQTVLDLRGLTLYDPCVPQYADEKALAEGHVYDLVILSHVLFWIPLEDLKAWVLPRIYRLARGTVFIAETIGDEKKRILSDRGAHPRGLHAIDWIELLLPFQSDDGPETVLVTEYRGSDTRIYAGRWSL